MCAVSMIGDHYNRKFTEPPYDWLKPYIHPQLPDWTTITDQLNKEAQEKPVSREEFYVLKKEVLEMKELLQKAVEYDKKTNQPHCETEEKIALLKQVAKLFGVELESILK